MATATADKKGMKRICPSCSTRYYDFNKRPVLCPNCKMEFTGEIKVRARRTRTAANDLPDEGQVAEKAVAEKAVATDDDDDSLLEGDDAVVSLDTLEDDDDDDVDEDEEDADPDLELDDDSEDDDDLDEDEDEEDDDDSEDDAKEAKKPRKKK